MTDFKRLTFLLLVLYAIVLSVNLAINYTSYANGGNWVFSIGFSLVVTTVGWFGYIVLYYRLFKTRLNWTKYPTGNLLFTVFLSGLYGVIIMVTAMKILALLRGADHQPLYEYIGNSTYAALFSMMLGLIINGQDFLQQWKKSMQDNERMKTELLRSQHETLKSQVNPHFLFNTLNTLASLIPENPVIATQFVQGLSSVIRYSLQNNSAQTVALSTELKVTDAFLFLNRQRFGERLQVEIDVSASARSKHIASHALLILVENAIKHNEISAEIPLLLRIYDEDDGMSLTVVNSFNPKSHPQPSLGLGLSNIVERYRIITARPVSIRKEQIFAINIPLLAA